MGRKGSRQGNDWPWPDLMANPLAGPLVPSPFFSPQVLSSKLDYSCDQPACFSGELPTRLHVSSFCTHQYTTPAPGMLTSPLRVPPPSVQFSKYCLVLDLWTLPRFLQVCCHIGELWFTYPPPPPAPAPTPPGSLYLETVPPSPMSSTGLVPN